MSRLKIHLVAALLMTGGLATLAETQGKTLLAEKERDPGGGQSNEIFYFLAEQEQLSSYSSRPQRGDLVRQAGATGEPHFVTVALTSGVPAAFSIGPVSSPTLMSLAGAYQITVPQGAERLEVRVSTTTPGADVDLYIRYDTPPDVVGGTVVYDHRSAQTGTGNETVIITTPRAGVWYITLLLYSTGHVATGTVTATIGAPGAIVLTSGVPAAFSIGPVTSPTLMSLGGAYQITVPQGAQRLEMRVSTTTPGADVDLYVRYGTPPDVVGGTVVCDYKSDAFATGNETVSITTPRAGVWYITLGLYSTGVTAAGTITGTIILPPQIEVFNAAGGQRDWICPGSIAVLIAPGIARAIQGCVSPRNPIGPLPLELANVTVAFGESWAPIYSVCNLDGQESVTVQVPFEVPPGSVSLRIRRPGSEFSTTVRVLDISPGVFEWRMRDGRSRPVMLRPDNSFVSVDNPARRGETVRVYAVGLGRLMPSVGTNQPGGALLDASTVLPVVVGVNGAGVEPLYAIYAPNLIGVYEVAFVVPANTPASDDVPFALALYATSSTLVFANSSTFPAR